MKFTESDIKNINQLFEDPNNAGYVLNFTNKSMREFFESELSIDIDNDIYRKTGAVHADLHAFHGKLDQKISWARGVFISWAGFTKSGLDAWGEGKEGHLCQRL